MKISIQKNHLTFIPEAKTFLVAGTEVKFGTEHIVVNDETGASMKFLFKESTGSEWDKFTVWIYHSHQGYELHVSNNDTTPEHAEAYFKAKTRI